MPCLTAATHATAKQDAGWLLCIEDNPVNGLLLEELFGHQLGLKVTVADTGRQGLALAREDPPMAVLLDMMLPDISGLEVLAQLRADPRTCQVPVVIVSGHVAAQDWAAAKALGVTACWPKPMDFGRLGSLLAQALPQVAACCARQGPAWTGLLARA